MAEAPQNPSRPNPFGILKQKTQAMRAPKDTTEAQVATPTEVDLTQRVTNGEQEITMGGITFVIKAGTNVQGDRLFYVHEINPGRAFGGEMKVIDSESQQRSIKKTMHQKVATYHVTLERGTTAAIVDRPMETAVPVPQNGKIVLISPADVRSIPQEIAIQNWVFKPPIATGPGK